MPVVSWKVPVALWLIGLAAKLALGALVSQVVRNVAGGVFGFAAVVTFALWAGTRWLGSRIQGGDAENPSA